MTMPYKARQATPLAPGREGADAGRTVATEAQDANQGPTSANGEHADSAVPDKLGPFSRRRGRGPGLRWGAWKRRAKP